MLWRFACGALVGAVLGWCVVRAYYAPKERLLEVNHAKAKLEMNSAWEKAADARDARHKSEISAAKKDRAALLSKHKSELNHEIDEFESKWKAKEAEQRAQQLEEREQTATKLSEAEKKLTEQQEVELWGNPTNRITRDPSLTIAEMLQQVAGLAAPAESQITVKVNRFTEFDVSVSFPKRPDSNQLARISIMLLNKEFGRYLNSLRFIVSEDDTIKVIDRRAIERLLEIKPLTADDISRATN
jgi:hypothetical protein